MKLDDLTNEHEFCTEELLGLVPKAAIDAYLTVFEKEFTRNSRPVYMDSIEWRLRVFRSAKHAIGAATFYCQAQRLGASGYANVVAYLAYYSMYHATAAVLMLMPSLGTRSLSSLRHSQVLDYACTELGDRKLMPADFQTAYNLLLATRETFSYRIPLGSMRGDSRNGLPSIELALEQLTRLLPGLIQLCNLLSHAAHRVGAIHFDGVTDEYEKHRAEVDEKFFGTIRGSDRLDTLFLMDEDDYRRLGWVLRQGMMPLDWFITEKLCEDLECGWWEAGGKHDFHIEEVARTLQGWLLAPS